MHRIGPFFADAIYLVGSPSASTRPAMHGSTPRRRPAAAPVLALTAWSLALPLLGCYRYVPVAKDATPSIGEGTVVLTAAGTTALAQQLGENVREIDGTILRVTADSLEVLVTQTTTTSRERFTQTAKSVSIARPLVEQVSEKQFSKRKTWTLVGLVVGVIAIALGATSIASSSGDIGGGQGPIQP